MLRPMEVQLYRPRKLAIEGRRSLSAGCESCETFPRQPPIWASLLRLFPASVLFQPTLSGSDTNYSAAYPTAEFVRIFRLQRRRHHSAIAFVYCYTGLIFCSHQSDTLGDLW